MAVSATAVFLPAAAAGRASGPPESFVDACQELFGQMRPGGSARTPAVMASNRRHIAWSVGTWQETPEVFRTALIVYDLASGRAETVFRTRTNPAGHVIGPDGRVWAPANGDQFCPVDWSRDSRYLLVRELIGRTESDNTSTTVWVYEVPKKQRALIRQSTLRRTLETHWKRKGANFRDVYYLLEPVGWEDSETPRPVFSATVVEGPPTSFPPGIDGFIGAWSVSLSGSAPKLLTESRTANVVRRYGQIVPHPTSWAPSGTW